MSQAKKSAYRGVSRGPHSASSAKPELTGQEHDAEEAKEKARREAEEKKEEALGRDLDRVTPYPQWRRRVGLSKFTAWRLQKEGKGPRLTHLSDRLLGVRERDHLAWLESRSYSNGETAMRLAERRLFELGRAVEAGHLDRSFVVEQLRHITEEAGLITAA
jgi:hypothetical protein